MVGAVFLGLAAGGIGGYWIGSRHSLFLLSIAERQRRWGQIRNRRRLVPTPVLVGLVVLGLVVLVRVL